MPGLLEEMPPGLLDEWRAFDLVEPLGLWRLELAAAQTTCAVLNGRLKRGAKPFTAAEVLPRFGPREPAPPAPAPTADQLRQKLQALNALFGGKVVSRG